jgi:exodeoxyribonuclease V gamma subunit
VLHIHRAERADRLVAALADVLAEPLLDPFATEIVAVPTRGIERWLAQTMASRLGAQPGRGDGVTANVDFPPPGALVGGAVAVATGIARDADPWLPERALWPLLDVVDEHLHEDWLDGLAAHLGASGDDPALRHERRLGVVRRLAQAFDRYAVHRPEMLRAWASGDDAAGDGTPLEAGDRWQALLWRQLRERLGTPSPPERLTAACERLRADVAAVDLPQRLALFGLTRLPTSHLDVLAALAVHRDVHLLLLHPSPALWSTIAASGEARGMVPREEDLTDGMPTSPLLRTWGRDARELQLIVAGASSTADHHHPLAEAAPATLLERLQADARQDRSPLGAPLPGGSDGRPALAAGDRSVQVHACHGRGRQVEVLRDAVLHLLAADETLEPRDVIVMCPDIETFAPLVHATFGAAEELDEAAPGTAPDAPPAGAGTDPPDLRVRLADRSLRQTNPVLAVVAQLLELVTSRVTSSQVLDLAGREPVRRRFRLDDDDLTRVEAWAASAGIRWGLDAVHRAPYGLDLEEGTWRAGLDRLLVGVAMSEDGQRLVDGVLPLDDVGSGDIALAGRVAELLDRLEDALDALSAPQSIASWMGALSAAADALTATGERDAWQRAQLGRLLDGVAAEAGDHAGEVAPAELRDLLADRLRGRPTRAGFRTGHVTVCTLQPMRSVPHRVVCLLGLDDGVFPRKGTPDGDDLVARDPHVGDHDGRTEDRQLLLDALLAAGQHLVVTYSGRDERTNAPLPPAVPIGELLDVVDATVRLDPAEHPRVAEAARGPLRARDAIVVAHPLQPFDVRGFIVGPAAAGRDGEPWAFDATALEGARALAAPRTEPPPFLEDRLPPVDGDLVELDALVRFVQHPVKAFLRQRLGIALTSEEEEPADALPIELAPLESWAVGQRMLDARLAGASSAGCREAELARGHLPPGGLALTALEDVEGTVEGIMRVVGELPGGTGPAGDPVDVHVELPDGRTLVGTVADLRGDVLRAVTYSRVGPKHRLAAWVRLLAVTATLPDRPFEALTVGRAPRGHRVGVAALPPLGGTAAERAAEAISHLAVLADLHERGLREPLPMYCRSSEAYARAAALGRPPSKDVTELWESGWRGKFHFEGEQAEAEHELVLGPGVTLRELVATPPRDDEVGDGWGAEERSRFGRYARRLWDGLLGWEQVSER